jgi:hypothetical protein
VEGVSICTWNGLVAAVGNNSIATLIGELVTLIALRLSCTDILDERDSLIDDVARNLTMEIAWNPT